MLAGLLALGYFTWRTDYGSAGKTDDVLHTSRERPSPLTLSEVEGANLLKILQQRELLVGMHALSLKVDPDGRARLVVCDARGCRHEFHLADSGTLAKAVNDTVRNPDESGFGFVIEKSGGKHMLRASAMGFVARVDTDDIDAGLAAVLDDQRQHELSLQLKRCAHHPKQSGLRLPYRSKTPFCLEEGTGEETITLVPAPTTANQFAHRP